MRQQQVITDFSTGEISPLSMGRVNTAQYSSACTTLENFIVSARGGVRKRPGMNFVAQGKTKGKPIRLIPFIYSREQAYVLELGDKYMRFHRSDGTLGTWARSDSRGSDPDKFGDTLFKPLLSSPENARELRETFTPYEIATPWSTDQIFDIHFAQANDVMILVHEEVAPQVLTRVSAESWTLGAPTGGWIDAPWTKTESKDSYPRTVVFYQQRTWFGGSPKRPQTLWASRVGDFFKFTINSDPDLVKPDDALELTIASYTQEKIEWLSSEKVLLIGTAGSEQRLTPDQYIAVNNVPNIARTSSYGGRHIMPVYIGELTIFIQGSGRQVRSYSQNNRTAVEKYNSRDLAWFAEHITESGVIAQSYELIPDSVLWQARADGMLLSMTHDPSVDDEDYTAMGWARHPTDGQVISVTTIPTEFNDETWTATSRNGGFMCIEYMNDNVYTDSSLTTPPDSETILSGVGGLSHLAGKTVKVIVDGAIQKDKVVSGTGTVSFDIPGKVVEVGLPYTATLVTTPYNEASSPGTNLGTQQRWAQIYAKIVDSALPLINGRRPRARTPSTPMDTPEKLTTGDYEIVGLGWDEDGSITVEQDLPKKTQLIALFGIHQSNMR